MATVENVEIIEEVVASADPPSTPVSELSVAKDETSLEEPSTEEISVEAKDDSSAEAKEETDSQNVYETWIAYCNDCKTKGGACFKAGDFQGAIIKYFEALSGMEKLGIPHLF